MKIRHPAFAWHMHLLYFSAIYLLLLYSIPEQWLMAALEELQDESTKKLNQKEIYVLGLLMLSWVFSLISFFIPPTTFKSSLKNMASWHIYIASWFGVTKLLLMLIPDNWIAHIFRETSPFDSGIEDIPFVLFIIITLSLNGVVILITERLLKGSKSSPKRTEVN